MRSSEIRWGEAGKEKAFWAKGNKDGGGYVKKALNIEVIPPIVEGVRKTRILGGPKTYV